MKAGKNIDLLGFQPSQMLRPYLQKAKAFIYAADEDFGMVTVEAQACGTPVIAYGRGGSVETVNPLSNPEFGLRNEGRTDPNGVFFFEQTIEALREAVRAFEKNEHRFDRNAIRKYAERFGIERFRREFKNYVDSVIESH
jgi:glycosyltransferase involved in cell wall biosynthesis